MKIKTKRRNTMRNYKTAEMLNVKMSGDGNGTVSGYGSTFGNFDSVKESVQKGAFRDTLPKFLRDGFVALNHDWDGLPIATVSNAYEDEKGLFVEAEFHGDERSQQARRVFQERLERGKSVSMSIGYKVLDAAPVQGGRALKRLELYEVSLVNVPANEMAVVSDVKAANPANKLPIHTSQKEGENNGINNHNRKGGAMWEQAIIAALAALLEGTTAEVQIVLDDTTMDAGAKMNKVMALVTELQNGVSRMLAATADQTGGDATSPGDATGSQSSGGSAASGEQTPSGAPAPVPATDPAASVGKQLKYLQDMVAALKGASPQTGVKLGRAVSTNNHARIVGWHTNLKSIVDDLNDFIQQVTPEQPKSAQGAEGKGQSQLSELERIENEFLKTLLGAKQ